MRVVERRRSVDASSARIAFSSAADVVGERLEDSHLAVEVDHLHRVVLAHAPGEADRRLLGGRSAPPCCCWCRAGSASAIGCCIAREERESCLTPSSKTSKSSCSRPVTYLRAVSVTVTFSDTSSTPRAETPAAPRRRDRPAARCQTPPRASQRARCIIVRDPRPGPDRQRQAA